MIKSYKFIVKGLVQGVYYRKNIQANALKKHFSGYVKNLPDKTVEACVTCDDSKVDEFIAILEKGSSKSRVDTIVKKEISEVYSGDFEIRR
jgi:acylphosphatase